jgi:hypothetical protein
MANRITISALETFIRRELPDQLRKDLLSFHIIREADLASCVYYHLRRFLRSDRTWRVLAEKHSYLTGHFIDIVIVREGKEASKKCQRPRIAIELKWNWSAISKKDRASLDRCIRQMGLEKVYFITALTKATGYRTIAKKDDEKFRLFEIAIPLGLEGKMREEWKLERRLFTKMSAGKRGISC